MLDRVLVHFDGSHPATEYPSTVLPFHPILLGSIHAISHPTNPRIPRAQTLWLRKVEMMIDRSRQVNAGLCSPIKRTSHCGFQCILRSMHWKPGIMDRRRARFAPMTNSTPVVIGHDWNVHGRRMIRMEEKRKREIHKHPLPPNARILVDSIRFSPQFEPDCESHSSKLDLQIQGTNSDPSRVS